MTCLIGVVVGADSDASLAGAGAANRPPGIARTRLEASAMAAIRRRCLLIMSSPWVWKILVCYCVARTCAAASESCFGVCGIERAHALIRGACYRQMTAGLKAGG